jgi:hypothetical protein
MPQLTELLGSQFQGNSGTSGFSGYSGMGTSGYSGAKGDQGISGYSGFAGSIVFDGGNPYSEYSQLPVFDAGGVE